MTVVRDLVLNLYTDLVYVSEKLGRFTERAESSKLLKLNSEMG